MTAIKRLARFALHVVSRLLVAALRCLPVRDRAFFFTIRADGRMLENLQCVYDACDCEKKLFAKMLPHSRVDMLRACCGLLTSRVIVTDDYVKYFRTVKLHPSQKVVQLWHACGAFKKFGLDAPSRLTPEEERQTHAPYTDVCVSAEGVRGCYAAAFGIAPERVKALGTPRTDLLLDGDALAAQRQALLADYPALAGKTIYLYMPTFREQNGEAIPFDPQLDFAALSQALGEDELLVIRRHPVMKEPFGLPDGPQTRVLDLSDVSALRLLSAASVVITDYSSVVFDAALLSLPMVFYCPDLAEYERSFYLDMTTDLPGEIVTQPEQLLGAIRRSLDGKNERLARFLQTQLSACDGRSTARIAALITGYLQGKKRKRP